MLFGLYGFPYPGYVALDADAELQLPAQRPETASNGGDLLRGRPAVLSGPADAVQHPPLVGQGVYFSLQSVILHGKLLRRFNAVSVQIGKLRLVAVKADHLVQN